MSALDSVFTDIANSIRTKLSSSSHYYPEDMAAAIDSISGGGGGIRSHLFPDGYSSELTYTHTFTESGLYLVIGAYSYQGSENITFSDAEIISSQSVTVDSRGATCKIAQVEAGSTVTITITKNQAWVGRVLTVIKLKGMTIDEFIDSNCTKDGVTSYTLPNDSNLYLVCGLAVGKSSSNVADRTDGTTASGSYETLSGHFGNNSITTFDIVKGSDSPTFKFYGYDGGFSAIFAWKIQLSGENSGVTVLSGTTDPTSSIGSNGNIYLKYNDAQAYELPSNCTPLTYIQTLDGAYIDTGVTPTEDTSADLYGLIPLKGSRYGNLLGEGDRSGRIWAIRYTENGRAIQFLLGVDGDAINSSNITMGESYDIHVEKGKLVINGTEYTGTTAVSFSDPMSSLKIFSDGGQQAASARISRCKIYEDGVLIRDMVPARYESGPAAAAGTIGMYDMVGDTFYYDTGNKPITGGPVMVDDQIIEAFLKVNGTWQKLTESSLDDVVGL